MIAAAYCAGMSGKAIRRAAILWRTTAAAVFARLLAARAAGLSDWLASPFGNPLLLDAEKFCEQFLPAEVPEDFAALKIPLTVIATDLHGRSEAVLSPGPLRPAVAASIAIPGLMRPVELDGRVLVDGAAVNPLPFDHLRGKADVVIAVDAAVGPGNAGAVPDPWEALAATMAVIGHGIVAQQARGGAPGPVAAAECQRVPAVRFLPRQRDHARRRSDQGRGEGAPRRSLIWAVRTRSTPSWKNSRNVRATCCRRAPLAVRQICRLAPRTASNSTMLWKPCRLAVRGNGRDCRRRSRGC